MPKRTTNTKFIMDLMTSSKFGALVEVFVIDALSKQARDVANATLEQLENPIISPEAWRGVAREIHEKIEVRYVNL